MATSCAPFVSGAVVSASSSEASWVCIWVCAFVRSPNVLGIRSTFAWRAGYMSASKAEYAKDTYLHFNLFLVRHPTVDLRYRPVTLDDNPKWRVDLKEHPVLVLDDFRGVADLVLDTKYAYLVAEVPDGGVRGALLALDDKRVGVDERERVADQRERFLVAAVHGPSRTERRATRRAEYRTHDLRGMGCLLFTDYLERVVRGS